MEKENANALEKHRLHSLSLTVKKGNFYLWGGSAVQNFKTHIKNYSLCNKSHKHISKTPIWWFITNGGEKEIFICGAVRSTKISKPVKNSFVSCGNKWKNKRITYCIIYHMRWKKEIFICGAELQSKISKPILKTSL